MVLRLPSLGNSTLFRVYGLTRARDVRSPPGIGGPHVVEREENQAVILNDAL